VTIIAGVLKPAAAIFYGKIFTCLANYGSESLGGQETLHNISVWCIALTALGVGAWLLEGAFFSSWIIFGELQAKTIRQQMFTGMLNREMEWYDLREDGIGSLLIRIQT
jgi:ATP-binding cassette subfamily B (MDR/TAP) protein 1